MSEDRRTPTPDDLCAIAPEDLPQNGDSKAIDEALDYDSQRKQAELDDFKLEVANRAKYTGRLFWLMVVWIAVILGILIASGIAVPADMPERACV